MPVRWSALLGVPAGDVPVCVASPTETLRSAERLSRPLSLPRLSPGAANGEAEHSWESERQLPVSTKRRVWQPCHACSALRDPETWLA